MTVGSTTMHLEQSIPLSSANDLDLTVATKESEVPIVPSPSFFADSHGSSESHSMVIDAWICVTNRDFS